MNEDSQQFGSVFSFGQTSPLDPASRSPHPGTTFAPIGDEFPENNYAYAQREGVTDTPSPIVTVGPGETLTPIVALRQETAAIPVLQRTPAILKYPKARRTLFIPSGTDALDVSLGFDCRAIQIQNVGTNTFVFCKELNLYLSTATTTLATFNLPEMAEKLSFQWHTAAFNPTSPVGVAGQGIVVWLYDEWVPPSFLASGGGGTASSLTLPVSAIDSDESIGPMLAARVGPGAIGTVVTPVANDFVIVPFVLQSSRSYANAFWLNGLAVAGNICYGVVDESGARIATTGSVAQAGAANAQVAALVGGPITIPAGKYYHCIAGSDAAVAQFRRYALSAMNARSLGCGRITAGTFPLPAANTLVFANGTAAQDSTLPICGLLAV